MRPLPPKLTTPASAALLLAIAFCAAYATGAGHGFIKDDFRWIRETRLDSWSDAPRLLARTDGFYRPLVSLSFSLNTSLGGLEPRAYGLTNVALALIAAALLWLLARRLGLTTAAALAAAGAWAFNFHGINMAVLWISGRTSLIVTIGALLTGVATVSRRPWLAGACCLLALLAKEEAVLLPVLVAAWCAYDADGTVAARIGSGIRRSLPCFIALAVYLFLRSRTDAFWPGDAPQYYRLTFSPTMLAANLVQYADRAITWPAVAALIAYATSGGRARFDAVERRVAIFGGMWLVSMFALTVFVPVRSSLYAVLPSVGSALAAGAVTSAAVRGAPARATMTLPVLVLLPLLLVPVYWLRNERWTQLAMLSSRVLQDVRTVRDQHPAQPIVLVDSPLERFTLDAAFGSLWPDAATLFLGREADAIVAQDAATVPNAIVLRLENGQLVRKRTE